ncbi:MAG: AMP-binding protein [Candidatus Rokubacteria bacterium]|nr:AMP-binding protein [Candidatus Rokubacteria bacterium]
MNVADCLDRHAAGSPAKIAVTDGDRTVTYAALLTASNRLIDALTQLGVRRHDRVGLALDNSLEFVIGHFAVQRMGATVVGINKRHDESTIDYVLKSGQVRALLADPDFLDKIDHLWWDLPQLEWIITTGDRDVYGTYNLGRLLAASTAADGLVDCRDDDLASLFFTAGTTGRPKGVPISHRVRAEIATSLARAYRVTPEDRSLAALPMFHTFGCYIGMFLPLYQGGAISVLREWAPKTALAKIASERVTFLAGVPTLFIQILNCPDLLRYDLTSLRTCVVGGAPVPANLIREFEERVAAVVINTYGMTGSMLTAHPYDGPRKYSSIGLPLPVAGLEVRVVDEANRVLPAGEVGEIVFRGPTMSPGFWKLPALTARHYRDGWSHSGDLGKFDEEGFLYLVDRKDDLIITSGFKVYPTETEDVLYSHSAVKECLVIGVPHPVKGQVPRAMIVLKKGAQASASELIEHCRGRLAHYKAPAEVEFVSELPKSDTGKILRRSAR